MSISTILLLIAFVLFIAATARQALGGLGGIDLLAFGLAIYVLAQLVGK